MMRINRNSKGFTLIELLIVVAIIGILAAIAIPAYSSYTKKARLAGVVHAMGAVKNAICAYYTESSDGTIPPADGAAAIATAYGVEPTTQYATFKVETSGAGTATITGDPLDSLVSGTLILKTTDMKTWSWTDSDVEASYKPKD